MRTKHTEIREEFDKMLRSMEIKKPDEAFGNLTELVYKFLCSYLDNKDLEYFVCHSFLECFESFQRSVNMDMTHSYRVLLSRINGLMVQSIKDIEGIKAKRKAEGIKPSDKAADLPEKIKDLEISFGKLIKYLKQKSSLDLFFSVIWELGTFKKIMISILLDETFLESFDSDDMESIIFPEYCAFFESISNASREACRNAYRHLLSLKNQETLGLRFWVRDYR